MAYGWGRLEYGIDHLIGIWGRGRNCFFLVELVEGEKIVRDVALPLSCIICCALLYLEEIAAMGIATPTESAEMATSFPVSALSVPEASLGDASTALTGAVLCIVCETIFALLGRLACFIWRVLGGDGCEFVTAA